MAPPPDPTLLRLGAIAVPGRAVCYLRARSIATLTPQRHPQASACAFPERRESSPQQGASIRLRLAHARRSPGAVRSAHRCLRARYVSAMQSSGATRRKAEERLNHGMSAVDGDRQERIRASIACPTIGKAILSIDRHSLVRVSRRSHNVPLTPRHGNAYSYDCRVVGQTCLVGWQTSASGRSSFAVHRVPGVDSHELPNPTGSARAPGQS